jgi:hypothetical protein
VSSITTENSGDASATPAPQHPVTLFQNIDYQGPQCPLREAGQANYCDGFNDQASSILIQSGWSARVFEDADLSGSSRCFTASDPNFTDNAFESGFPLNDQVSSFAAYHQSNCPPPPATPTPTRTSILTKTPTPSSTPTATVLPCPVTLYQDADYQEAQCPLKEAGQANYCDGFNDQASSILIRSGWSARVFEDIDLSGSSRCFTASDPNFTDDAFESGFPLNDQVSSFAAYHRSNCPSPTAPPTVTPTSSQTPTPTSTATPRPTRTPTATSTSTASLTPTQTPIPTATHQPGYGVVTGHVFLQGRTYAGGTSISLDGAPLVTTGSDGNYELHNIAPGLHRVGVEHISYLCTETDVTVSPDQTIAVGDVTLRAGDVNGDHVVNIFDLVVLASNYSSSPPTDTRTDLNGDNKVNIFDLVLQGNNWDRRCPTPWLLMDQM